MKWHSYKYMSSDMKQKMDTQPSSVQYSLDANCKSYEDVVTKLSPIREDLEEHHLYDVIKNIEAVKCFAGFHVWTVWDFQNLLTALQIRLTCTVFPWYPTPDNKARRFINQLVLDTESGCDISGEYSTDLELYLNAMKQIAIDVTVVEDFIKNLKTRDLFECMDLFVPSELHPIISHTFDMVHEETHCLLAALEFGFLDVEAMILNKINKGSSDHRVSLSHVHADDSLFKYYCNKQNDISRTYSCKDMLIEMCGDNVNKWNDVFFIAGECLYHKLNLFDIIAAELDPENEKKIRPMLIKRGYEKNRIEHYEALKRENERQIKKIKDKK